MKLRILIIVLYYFIVGALYSQDIPFEKAFFTKEQRDGLKEAQKTLKKVI